MCIRDSVESCAAFLIGRPVPVAFPPSPTPATGITGDWEDLMISKLVSYFFCLGLTWTQTQAFDGDRVRLAQQTVTVPAPSTGIQSVLPQAQTLTNCLLNCNTSAGVCQGTCSSGNSPTLTLASPVVGVRPDPGALSQCNLNCNTQALACRQTCAIQSR